MKKPILKVRAYRHSKNHKFILDLRGFGKGRMFFKTRVDADNECQRQKSLLERHSRAAIGLSPREMSEIIAAKQKLAEYGETITNATAFFIDHLERVRRSGITVKQLADEVVEAKRRDGLSKDYLVDLELRLRRFSQDFGSRAIASVTVEEIDDWLRNLDGAPGSRANYRRNVGVLFSYATKRRILDLNPVLYTAKPKLIDKAPDIFSVDDLRSLLEVARRVAPAVVPMLAIGAFAGLRDAEIERLDWSEVDLARGHIEVKAAKAKSARRRIVPIQPNLAAWLQPYSGMIGRVMPPNPRARMKRVRKAAGLARWPLNGLRHSYASYRLADIHDAPRVASELGHGTPQMLYSVYRELVHPDEAKRYWSITPAAESEKVVAFTAS
jgi:integrase